MQNSTRVQRPLLRSSASRPSSLGYVLYAVTDAEKQSVLRNIDTRVADRGGPPGLELIEAGSLTALIGPYCKPRRFRSLDYNRQLQLKAQQVVLETAMEDVRVLPAALGTHLPSRSKIVRLLNIHGDHLRSQLNTFGDLVEFEVLVSWDANEIVRSILTMDGLEIPNGSRSNRNMARALEMAIETKRRTLRAHIDSAIKQVARDTISVETSDANALSRQIVLLSKDREDHFYDLLRKINATGEGKISIKCIGPLPPCSFAAVQVWKTPLDEVTQARSTLRLGRSVAMSEIQAAYRNALNHPQGQDGLGTKKISEVRSSYQLLTQIAESQSLTYLSGAMQRSASDDALVQLDQATLLETYLVSIGKRGSRTDPSSRQ